MPPPVDEIPAARGAKALRAFLAPGTVHFERNTEGLIISTRGCCSS